MVRKVAWRKWIMEQKNGLIWNVPCLWTAEGRWQGDKKCFPSRPPNDVTGNAMRSSIHHSIPSQLEHLDDIIRTRNMEMLIHKEYRSLHSRRLPMRARKPLILLLARNSLIRQVPRWMIRAITAYWLSFFSANSWPRAVGRLSSLPLELGSDPSI